MTHALLYCPIHLAAARDHGQVVKYLIQKGADPECKTATGARPLHMAAKHGDMNALQALLESGVEIDVKDSDGTTPWQVSQQSQTFFLVNKSQSCIYFS